MPRLRFVVCDVEGDPSHLAAALQHLATAFPLPSSVSSPPDAPSPRGLPAAPRATRAPRRKGERRAGSSNGHANGHGSAEDRILAVLKEAADVDEPSVRSSVLMTQAKLDAPAFRKATKALVESGQIRREGRTTNTTYVLEGGA